MMVSRKLYRSLVLIGNSAMQQDLQKAVSNHQVQGHVFPSGTQRPDAHSRGSAVANLW